jgi:sialic acid synthase SpsE
MTLTIGNHTIGLDHPTYFIADIAANHDGSLERAKLLIRLAKQQARMRPSFRISARPKIVSDYGFTHMNAQVSHQAKWKKSVSEVYAEASIPLEWSPLLKAACDEVGIDYFSSPLRF